MSKPPNQKTIAILGANGRLSREVARAFNAAGWKVRAVTRNGECPALSNCTGMEFAAADAFNRQALMKACKDTDVVFNGLNPSDYTQWEEKALPMAENALAAIEAAGALHLFPGNIYNFGTDLPAVLTPQTPFRPDHSKADIRCRMEALFNEAAKRNAVQTIIVRQGDFFGGDGNGSWFDLVIAKDIAKGKLTWPGRRDVVHAWAYLPDLAKVFVRLAERSDQLEAFEIFHFEGHNVTGDQMHAAIEAASGLRLKKAGMPHFVLKLAGIFSPLMRAVSVMYYLWQKPHSVKDDRLKALIGPVYHTPLEKAVRHALIGQNLLPGSAAPDNEATIASAYSAPQQ